MKTSYKILIVIVITLSVYGGLYLGVYSCSSIYDCEILANLYEYVGITALSHVRCSMFDANECTVGITFYHFPYPFLFFFFFVGIPISIILTILYRDRKK